MKLDQITLEASDKGRLVQITNPHTGERFVGYLKSWDQQQVELKAGMASRSFPRQLAEFKYPSESNLP